jgi:hypothetical protein
MQQLPLGTGNTGYGQPHTLLELLQLLYHQLSLVLCSPRPREEAKGKDMALEGNWGPERCP